MENGPRPLDGIRVLELASIVAGPFCGALMAEFGAEVIKTEIPGRGDDIRRMGPQEDGVGYWWAQENRGKKVFTLDLHHAKGQEIVKRLVPQVDVVLENFRPGILEKWNLGWEELHRINPRLIMARVTAFGQTGPRSHGPGFAAIGSAFGGTWYLNGTPDQPPVRPTPVYPDYLTGLFTAFGVLAALRHRDNTGAGQWIDAALYESAFRVTEYSATFYGRQGVVRERGARQHVGWPGAACQTKDGHWVAYTAPAQHLFERLCAMLGQPDLPKDARFTTAEARSANLPEFMEEVVQWFAARTYDEVEQALEKHQVPYSRIMTMADVFTDPHYKVRNMLLDVPHPTLGSLPQPAVVPKLSASPGRVPHAGPALGEHTEEILGAMLGMSPAEIAALRAEGVV
jgi:crotonobetainyl-CoA:carnitine CoA-transferase CaiB-like acyl-CoA transferase